MHVIGVETGAREHRRHLGLAVHALFAQHRNRGSCAARDVGSGDVLGRIEAQRGMQAGIVHIEEPRVFLACALRIVAQRLHAKRHLAPASVQFDARTGKCHSPVGRDRHRGAGHGLAQFLAVGSEPVALEDFAHLEDPCGRNLHDRAELFGKTGSDRIRDVAEIDVETAMAGEGHLQQRHQQPAVGAVVVGEQ